MRLLSPCKPWEARYAWWSKCCHGSCAVLTVSLLATTACCLDSNAAKESKQVPADAFVDYPLRQVIEAFADAPEDISNAQEGDVAPSYPELDAPSPAPFWNYWSYLELEQVYGPWFDFEDVDQSEA